MQAQYSLIGTFVLLFIFITFNLLTHHSKLVKFTENAKGNRITVYISENYFPNKCSL